jgi:hypothetical protein
VRAARLSQRDHRQAGSDRLHRLHAHRRGRGEAGPSRSSRPRPRARGGAGSCASLPRCSAFRTANDAPQPDGANDALAVSRDVLERYAPRSQVVPSRDFGDAPRAAAADPARGEVRQSTGDREAGRCDERELQALGERHGKRSCRRRSACGAEVASAARVGPEGTTQRPGPV